jgi:hypothetical protein
VTSVLSLRQMRALLVVDPTSEMTAANVQWRNFENRWDVNIKSCSSKRSENCCYSSSGNCSLAHPHSKLQYPFFPVYFCWPPILFFLFVLTLNARNSRKQGGKKASDAVVGRPIKGRPNPSASWPIIFIGNFPRK